MGFGLRSAIGQPCLRAGTHRQAETQMFQDPPDRIGVFDCAHDAHLFLTARTDQGVRLVG